MKRVAYSIRRRLLIGFLCLTVVFACVIVFTIPGQKKGTVTNAVSTKTPVILTQNEVTPTVQPTKITPSPMPTVVKIATPQPTQPIVIQSPVVSLPQPTPSPVLKPTQVPVTSKPIPTPTPEPTPCTQLHWETKSYVRNGNIGATIQLVYDQKGRFCKRAVVSGYANWGSDIALNAQLWNSGGSIKLSNITCNVKSSCENSDRAEYQKKTNGRNQSVYLNCDTSIIGKVYLDKLYVQTDIVYVPC